MCQKARRGAVNTCGTVRIWWRWGWGVVSEAGAGAGPGGRGAQVKGASKEFPYSVPAEGMLSRNLHSFMGTGLRAGAHV